MKKKNIKQSLTTYFSKLKKVPSHVHLSFPRRPAAITTSRLLSSCKYPKTPSFNATGDSARHRTHHSAKLSDIDSYLQEHFKSLYINESQISPPVHLSDRFFVSPGTSSSLTDEAASFGLPESEEKAPGGGVAVTTYSRSPYEDFQRSMLEMVDARPDDVRHELDWDFMEDLLNWYLKSNERGVHKHILRAFVDLTEGFRRREAAAKGLNRVVGKSVRRRRRGKGKIEGEAAVATE